MTTGIWVDSFMDWRLKASDAHVAVVIDGVPHNVAWGEHFVSVPPGVHSVSVWWAYRRARSGIEVHVPEDGTAVIRFDAPRWSWQSGKLSLVDA